jgi:hypothetical protein
MVNPYPATSQRADLKTGRQALPACRSWVEPPPLVLGLAMWNVLLHMRCSSGTPFPEKKKSKIAAVLESVCTLSATGGGCKMKTSVVWKILNEEIC